MSTAGFFNRQESSPVQSAASSKSWVNVGGKEGDRWLRQAAVSIIDTILTNPLPNRDLASRLLAAHGKYFPSTRSPERLLRSDERLASMVSTAYGMEKMIHQLAFTLRQLTLDELTEHPTAYPEVFHRSPSPATLRSAHAPVHESAIAALANSLQTPFRVRVTQSGKDLPSVLYYGPWNEQTGKRASVMSLARQEDNYFSAVHKPERFKAVNALSEVLHDHVEVAKPTDPKPETIQTQIQKEDERLLKTYGQHVRSLQAMIKAGEVNKDALLAVYCRHLPAGKSGKELQYSGLQHGTFNFFEQMEKRALPANGQLEVRLFDSHEKRLEYELVRALSQGMSTGVMDESSIYSQLEEQIVAPARLQRAGV